MSVRSFPVLLKTSDLLKAKSISSGLKFKNGNIASIKATQTAKILHIRHDIIMKVMSTRSFALTIVIRNGKIVWKHGPNRPFFLYNLSSENY